MPDIIIIGGGPAGLSAAITARQRDKSAAVISGGREESALYKAHEVGNYPGLPAISGAELSCKMALHAIGVGAELIKGRVSVISSLGNGFTVGYGTELLSANSVILATGIVQTSTIPGETELLGRGVSYCATCDGMFFRRKRVCVVCRSPEAESEAEYLSSIGCEVTRIYTEKIEINGDGRVESVTASGETIPCEGVFILRRATAPHLLLPTLTLSDGHIETDRSCKTAVPGVFAAGDCIGAPYQIAKAVGEGLVAALSACEYLAAALKKDKELQNNLKY